MATSLPTRAELHSWLERLTGEDDSLSDADRIDKDGNEYKDGEK